MDNGHTGRFKCPKVPDMRMRFDVNQIKSILILLYLMQNMLINKMACQINGYSLLLQ